MHSHTVNNGLAPFGRYLTTECVQNWICDHVTGLVSRKGFSLFQSPDRLEDILKIQRYLIGNQLTEAGALPNRMNLEADTRIYARIVRFDAAYRDGFKHNIGSIHHNGPALNHWLRISYRGEDDSFRKWTNLKHVWIYPFTPLTAR